MKAITDTKIDLIKGRDILRKAISSEKQACRYWAQYVQWTVEQKVPLEQIAEQLSEAKGWKIRKAHTHARDIILLGQPENLQHLEDLMNGDISFGIACLRVNPPTTKKNNYQDAEAATQYLQKAVAIMLKLHSKWSLKDLIGWITRICIPIINQNKHSNEQSRNS